MAEYRDRTWEKQRYWTENTLVQPPSFYMDQNVFGSFIHDREGILNRDRPGGRNIMWSSDYPHSETTWPNSLKLTREWMSEFPESERRKMLYENAARLYHI